MNISGVRNLPSVVVFLVVIVQYKLFIVQYKSVDFRAVSAATVKMPAELLAYQHDVCPRLAEWMVNVFQNVQLIVFISVPHGSIAANLWHIINQTNV